MDRDPKLVVMMARTVDTARPLLMGRGGGVVIYSERVLCISSQRELQI